MVEEPTPDDSTDSQPSEEQSENSDEPNSATESNETNTEPENNEQDESETEPNSEDTDSPADEQTNSEPESPEALVDEITTSLSDDGFGVFHGREFISIRENGMLAPNSTVSEQYLDDKEAVILAYNEKTNEIAIIPLEKAFDQSNVYTLQSSDDRVSVSASGFLKDNEIETDKTIRYSPDWNEDIGGDHVPGGLIINLDQEGEVAPSSEDTTTEEDSVAEA